MFSSEKEVLSNKPKGANKYILFKDGTYLYLKVNDFFEYWNQDKWQQVGGAYHIKFDMNMVGIFPICPTVNGVVK